VVKDPRYQFSLIWRYARTIGWPAAIRLRFCDLQLRAGLSKSSLLQIKLKNAAHPLFMRMGSSDREVLGQVFIEEQYRPIALLRPQVILDLGANVGYSSAYFLSKYPSSSVLAVEPEPDNYAICVRNLARFGQRSRVVLGAAWPESSKLALDRGSWRDGREWSTRVQPASGEDATCANIIGYDIPTLIGLSGFSEIDLLKIDIENSELELFSRNTNDWLPCIRNLCVELHGPDCEAVFFRALSGYSYDLSRSDELTVCRNLRPRR
jgi:FkbM family methyltransferase